MFWKKMTFSITTALLPFVDMLAVGTRVGVCWGLQSALRAAALLKTWLVARCSSVPIIYDSYLHYALYFNYIIFKFNKITELQKIILSFNPRKGEKKSSKQIFFI